jgi:hypothetical protein
MPETLAFYRTLGFEVTLEQDSPYVYAATRRDDLQLHFFGLRGLKPENGYSTCLVIVPDVEELHRRYAKALRARYGKLPVAGFPRISRMKKGQSRFTVVDVDGNSVIYVREDAPDDYDEGAAEPTSNTPLGKALKLAARLRDFKNDDRAAAHVLEAALRKDSGSDPFERARALAARAELAVAMGDRPRAERALAEIAGLPLDAAATARLRPALDAVAALKKEMR